MYSTYISGENELLNEPFFAICTCAPCGNVIVDPDTVTPVGSDPVTYMQLF